MMRRLRSDWQTKVTSHAHHPLLEHQGWRWVFDAISAARYDIAREDYERRIPNASHPTGPARVPA